MEETKSYLVRPAVPCDIPQLTALRIAYLQEEFADRDIPQATLDAITQQLPAYFSAHLGGDCFVFVAEQEGVLLSNVILCCMEKPANLRFPSGKSGIVLGVYTKPEFRGIGCATALMTRLLSQAKMLGLDIVQLSASEMGKSIYEKLGFQASHSKFTEMEYVL